jgi:hypothetical protein
VTPSRRGPRRAQDFLENSANSLESYSTKTSCGYHVRQANAHTNTATTVQIWTRLSVRRGFGLDDAASGTIDVKSTMASRMSLDTALASSLV